MNNPYLFILLQRLHVFYFRLYIFSTISTLKTISHISNAGRAAQEMLFTGKDLPLTSRNQAGVNKMHVIVDFVIWCVPARKIMSD
jgi:hypothetical protein